jgi:hypothetical protein
MQVTSIEIIKQKVKHHNIDPTLPNLFENHQGSIESCPYHWTIAKSKRMFPM